jgi:hypothetical protein
MVTVTFLYNHRVPAATMPGEDCILELTPPDSSHNHGIGTTNTFLERNYRG